MRAADVHCSHRPEFMQRRITRSKYSAKKAVRAAGDTLGKDKREVERLIRWVERRAAIRRAAADDIGF